jgi:1,4-dihydroxy-2-naphthoate octaprenyltransferase
MREAASNWAAAIRPKTLWAAVGPVLVGTAFAFRDGLADLTWAGAALAAAILLQVGTNLHNDWSDARHGADNAQRRGPVRVTQAGLLTPTQVLRAALVAFFLAAVLGVVGTIHAGWPIAVLAAASVAAGLAYTGGSRPLGYRGFGDVLVLLFFGPVAVVGTYYVQALQLTPQAALAGLGPGLVATAVLVANNIRDRGSDQAASKRTLVVRLGPAFGRWEYAACAVLGTTAPTLLLAADGPRLWHLLPLVALAPALALSAVVLRGADGIELNPLLGRTAQLLLLSALMTAVAALITA